MLKGIYNNFNPDVVYFVLRIAYLPTSTHYAICSLVLGGFKSWKRLKQRGEYMRVSRILQKLRSGDYVLVPSVWTVPHWKIVDMMGVVGFDGVWLENEHSDFSLGELSQMTLAARAHDMDAIVRIARTGYTSFIRPLEAGATGLIIPHCGDGKIKTALPQKS